jgi:hypothetical protein
MVVKMSKLSEKKCRERGYLHCIGNKASVFNGHAERTAGGKKKSDIMVRTDKHGGKKYVFKSRHAAGVKALSHLQNQGFIAKKGEFRLFPKKSNKSRKSSRKSRR